MNKAAWLCCFLLCAPLAQAAPEQAPLTPAQQSQVTRIGEGLRCPICRDTLPITESGNEVSHEMLTEIGRQVREGKSDEDIYRFFTSRYGERIRLSPERRGPTLLLWALPLLALIGGGAWLLSYLRGQPTNAEDPDPYLSEVRAQVARQSDQGEKR